MSRTWEREGSDERTGKAVQELPLADTRRPYPDADEPEQALRLVSDRLATDLMVRVFGWDVRKAGY